jgi:hypothetical protein
MRSTSRNRIGLPESALRLVLTVVVVGQLGVGASLVAAWAGAGDACGTHRCPCDSEDHTAGTVDEASHPCEDSCPDHGSGLPCLPGCDDCTCAPGVVVAVMSTTTTQLMMQSFTVQGPQASSDHIHRSLDRVFRPPRAYGGLLNHGSATGAGVLTASVRAPLWVFAMALPWLSIPPVRAHRALRNPTPHSSAPRCEVRTFAIDS